MIPLTEDLDHWAGWLRIASNMHVTRDPDLVIPPCIYIDLPEITGRTHKAIRLDVPVYLIAAGTGKQAGDALMDGAQAFLDVLEVNTATPRPLLLGETAYHTLHATASITITQS